MIKIYNGDCLEVMKSQELQTISTEKRIVIVTDPPFNIGYHYASYKDNMEESAYYAFLSSVFTLYEVPFVVVHYPEPLYKLSHRLNKIPQRVISWVYNSNTARQHRDIAFFGVEPELKNVHQEYKNPTDKRIAQRIAEGKQARSYDWWNINQVKNVSKYKNLGGVVHPCVMPTEVMEKIVCCLPSDYVILDPFMGSGTTGIACVKNERNFIGIELDKEYFDIAKKRIEKAERESHFKQQTFFD